MILPVPRESRKSNAARISFSLTCTPCKNHVWVMRTCEWNIFSRPKRQRLQNDSRMHILKRSNMYVLNELIRCKYDLKNMLKFQQMLRNISTFYPIGSIPPLQATSPSMESTTHTLIHYILRIVPLTGIGKLHNHGKPCSWYIESVGAFHIILHQIFKVNFAHF